MMSERGAPIHWLETLQCIVVLLCVGHNHGQCSCVRAVQSFLFTKYDYSFLDGSGEKTRVSVKALRKGKKVMMSDIYCCIAFY